MTLIISHRRRPNRVGDFPKGVIVVFDDTQDPAYHGRKGISQGPSATGFDVMVRWDNGIVEAIAPELLEEPIIDSD